MVPRVNYSGLVVAGAGFFLTRFTVTLALYEDPVQFYLAGVVPLALGLGLAAFGVALTVGDVDPAVVRTTARYCVLGTVMMLLLAVLTVVGSSASQSLDLTTALSQSYLSNFLIGGSIGGTFTGLYAARNHRQRRELRQHTNRLVILNRMLRHEVLNALTAIQGYASLDGGQDVEAEAVIKERSSAIERTIEDVKYLTRHSGRGDTGTMSTEVGARLAESIQAVEARHPEADVSLGAISADLRVRADEQLTEVFSHLLENAVVHADDPSPSVEVSAGKRDVRVSIIDAGPGLAESQRALLETGTIGEFDNPKTGFGLNLVRLFVAEYDGDIDTDVSESGTRITVSLPRATQPRSAHRPTLHDLAAIRPALPHFIVTFVTALIAGGFYGLASEALGGSVAGIGVFYGTADPVVGWITHEFHSVVFGFVFVGLVAVSSDRLEAGAWTFLGIGVGWAAVLWAGAAGIVAPIWLQLLGIPASIPNLSVSLLVSHLAWGISLALLTAAGYTYVVPALHRHADRLPTSVRR